MKFLVITDRSKQVLFASKGYVGAKHDFEILKLELSKYDFSKHTIWVDSGFIGINKILKSKATWIPRKSSKYNKLDDLDNFHNHTISSNRIVVENAISDIKRHHILKNRHRHLNMKNISETFQICSALANFKLKNTLSSKKISLNGIL